MSRQAWRDLGLAAGVAALTVAGAFAAPPARTPFDEIGALLLVVAGLGLAPLRRAPRLVLLVVAACLLTYLVLGYPGVGPALPVLFALYATVRTGARGMAAGVIATILVGGVSGELARAGTTPPDAFQRWFLLIGWMVAASVLAEVTRQRRAYLDQVERRAEDAERTREEMARRRADEERLRIARELHDSLTHSISIIKVQAGVAIHLARKRDEAVPEALLAIQHASGEAMRELRNTLEVLRTPPPADEDGRTVAPLNTDAAGGSPAQANGNGPPATTNANHANYADHADHADQTNTADDNHANQDHGNDISGLGRLDQLVDGARRAGLPVSVHVDGRPRELPGAVDGAAYRIVQEALTNVARHAGEARAAVHLEYGDCTLTVRVDDDGCGAAEPVPGVGLTGMRERVSALGGELRAGPREDGGGFTVRAALPLPVHA